MINIITPHTHGPECFLKGKKGQGGEGRIQGSRAKTRSPHFAPFTGASLEASELKRVRERERERRGERGDGTGLRNL